MNLSCVGWWGLFLGGCSVYFGRVMIWICRVWLSCWFSLCRAISLGFSVWFYCPCALVVFVFFVVGGGRLSGLLVVGSLRVGVLDLGEGVIFLDGGLVDCCFLEFLVGEVSLLCGVLLLCVCGLSCLDLCEFFLGVLLLCLLGGVWSLSSLCSSGVWFRCLRSGVCYLLRCGVLFLSPVGVLSLSLCSGVWGLVFGVRSLYPSGVRSLCLLSGECCLECDCWFPDVHVFGCLSGVHSSLVFS